ncbi:hypothetical protein B0H13DRAFT_2491377 [Mycena leptocephala]|nr:hypothetical protein B0H13DRAFT_2491377 [Mycena leptocephala]
MSTPSVAITAAPAHATLPLGFSRARYHDLDTKAPRMVFKIQEVRRHLDLEVTRQKLLKLRANLAHLGPYPTRKQKLADLISKLQRRIDSPSAHSQLERMLAELEDQQAREKCGVRSPQTSSPGPLDLEMRTLLNILRVCSSWRAVALGTPDLWSKLTYADNGTLPLAFYDNAFIHSTLSNIPWIQLSGLEFRVEYDTRVISPSELASILSQAHNLTNLLVNLGPDNRFGPSSAEVLQLLNLRSLEISWIDGEEYYQLGIVTHSFIDLFHKLRVPALKSLKLTVDKHVNPYVLPVLTGFAGRSGFSLESLHIKLCSPIPTALSPAGTIAFLREQMALKSLHWHSYDCDLPELVEALTSIGSDSETLLPNLVDISLGLNSYEGPLLAFTNMVASRQAVSRTIALLHSFHLRVFMPYPESYDHDSDDPPPLLDDEIKDANEKASRRLLDLSKQGLRGSLDFRHFDQALKFTEPEYGTNAKHFVEMSQASGENLRLDTDDDMVWHWVDAQTLYRSNPELFF